MGSFVQVLRFFRAVPPVPPLMTGTFAALAAILGGAIALVPARAHGALVPVLLLQALATASGFASPARRGHYDLLLTGQDRRIVALVHWLASAVPGLVCWLVLAAVEVAVSGGASRGLLTSGTLAAVTLVSTLPWALTVGLPRFSAGIAWLLTLATASTTFSVPLFGGWAIASDGADGLVSAAVRFLLNPTVSVGRQLTPAEAWATAPAEALALAAMLVALRWASRSDVPLESAQ